MKIKSGIIIAAVILANTSYAGDIKRGQELHDENCTSCHKSMLGGDGSGIYTREDRRIDSYEGLVKQVKRCKTSLGVSWPEHQIDDVITYLNDSFYKFNAD
ncbi:hypothetical protein MNBD_GAMMA21-1176 [hydrothermal vent metagenome]|uniref:Cytochrome c domain-containing protein n=1 Tax=hydrothermal vent metagenome TaxID=652676 RepID=A0A3B1A1G2_9ZZZZ